MDYHAVYNRLIERAKSRVPQSCVERHHIIPRCMGGSDAKHNLVELTPEEHFFAHVLLVRMFPEKPSLISAVSMMQAGHKGKRARVMYGWLKKRHSAYMSISQSGEGNSNYGLRWVTDEIHTKRIGVLEDIPAGWRLGRPRKPKIKKAGPGRGYKKNALRFRADPHDVLRRYEGGETTDSIGATFDVSGKAIIQYLNHCFPDRSKFAPRQKRALVV